MWGERKYKRVWGSVTPDEVSQQRREEEILDELAPGRDLGKRDTGDIYRSPGRRVSLEGEAEKQLRLQEGLDREVANENLNILNLNGKGLPPCKRVGDIDQEEEEKSRKIGRFGW